MTVQSKWYVQSRTEIPLQGAETGFEIKLIPIWEGADADGANIAKENHIFSKATPSGEMRMFITNHAAAAEYKPGTCHIFTSEPTGLPAYAKK
jgi:hypothetical protein